MLQNSPFVRAQTSITRVMLKVLIALIPGIAVYVWQFGVGILVQIALATLTALAAEALMLALRGKALKPFLTDLSAVLTAWLIALSFPAIAPWWLVVTGTVFAIVVAKHLYGGLGQNPFNPAMVAYCAMIVAFPALMSQWPSAQLDASAQIKLIFGADRVVDAITSATPLETLRTGLHQSGATVGQLVQGAPFGWVAGKGLEYVAAAYLLGGLWLVQQRVITWHVPVGFLGALVLISGAFWLINGSAYASPLLHAMAGGSMLGAFFILTDPVSGSTTSRGKLIFAAGAAFMVWLIRTFGGYPDGVAFATLIMNLCVPLIDMKTQPPVFGHKKPSQKT